MIHVLIGASLLMLPWLREVPMAVLYGLFLFMGIVSMKGNQLSERLGLWFMDRGLYPSTHYTRRSPMSTIHGFTALQFGVVVVLWMVKVNSLAILFPVFIAAAVPMGMLAGRLFAPQHLAALDAEEEPDEEEPHWSGQQDCRPYRSRIAANLRQSSPSPGKTATESGHRGQEQGNQGSSIDEDTWPRCNWSNGVNMSHSTETPISCQPHLLERK